MNDIRELLKLAARRIEFSAFLQCAHFVAIAGASIALLLMVLDRLFEATFVPWIWIAPILALLVLGVAVILWTRRRHDEIEIALAVDDRLELREKMTTALYCHGRDDPFAQAAMEDGVRLARDQRTRESVRRRFSVTAPGGWWITPLLVFLVVMVSFLKPLNLFDSEQPRAEQLQKANMEVNESVNVLVQDLQKTTQLKSELSDVLKDLEGAGSTPKENMSPEELRREAIKKVTDLNRKLEDLLQGEKGKTAEAVENAMSQLKPPSDGPAKDLADALKDGDFQGAQKALQEMMDKLKAGELDDQQQKQMKQQLEDIANQLKDLAQKQQQLKDALKQAGMDPQLANNPQALQQQIQQNQNLNEEQKQQLQQMAQAQQAAQQMCQGLGQACQNMAGAMNGQMGQGQNGQQMAGAAQQAMQQLGDMEALQQLLQEAQAAANACQGQCQGMGQGLAMQKALQQWRQGGAFGPNGRGAGGKAPIAPTPSGTKTVKAPVKTTEGEIIFRTLVDGPQRVGESTKQITQVALHEISDAYDQAVDEDELPRKYDDAMLHYFGEVERQVQARQVEARASESAGDEPTGETSDSGAQSADDD